MQPLTLLNISPHQVRVVSQEGGVAMLISFRKLKQLAIISAIIIIPFIGINLLHLSLDKDSQAVNQIVENVDPA